MCDRKSPSVRATDDLARTHVSPGLGASQGKVSGRIEEDNPLLGDVEKKRVVIQEIVMRIIGCQQQDVDREVGHRFPDGKDFR